MAVLTFDTYDLIESLKESGFPEKQAKAVADGLKMIELRHVATKEDFLFLKQDITTLGKEMATKAEILLLRQEMVTKTELNELREAVADVKLDVLSIRTDMERVKFDLLKWIIPLLVGQTAAFIALGKLI
jgi:hypothetical protein